MPNLMSVPGRGFRRSLVAEHVPQVDDDPSPYSRGAGHAEPYGLDPGQPGEWRDPERSA